MNKEFMSAINQVCHERQLPKEVVLEAIEAALISAYKRNFGAAQTITAKIDPETGEAKIFVEKEVVAEIIDDKKEMLLKEAQKHKRDAEIGDIIHIETTPTDFGRIAAQTAKQVILQRIREAERESLYNAYAEREGEIINGTVQSIEPNQVTLSLGKVEAILPRSEQIPTERYRIGQRVRAYVSEVQKTPRGPTIIVSRTHRNMLRRLLELEVPEIYNGTVEIKSIAREAGYRSKVAVAALQEGIDPVGSCVGMRGVRIQSIVNELNGEKTDVVQWSPDVTTFIAHGLSPAKVLYVTLEDKGHGKTATVVVPDKQLSLAIGKEGQNARLAAKLTNWRIDIKSATEAAEEALRKASEEEAMRNATANDRDILAIAEDILKEKDGASLSEAELQALSRAIQAVDQAEAILAQEREAARREAEAERAQLAEETPKKKAKVDLLAHAEALLTGKSVDLDKVEGEAEAEVVAEVEPSLDAAAAVQLSDEAPVAEEEIVAEAEAPKVEAITAKVIETEPISAVESEEVALEAPEAGGDIVIEEETIPEIEDKPVPVLGTRSVSDFSWVDIEDDDDDDDSDHPKRSKKKRRSKKRKLVFDEELGEVVSHRKRKPGRQREDWEDYY